jgi:hypothetical protein
MLNLKASNQLLSTSQISFLFSTQPATTQARESEKHNQFCLLYFSQESLPSNSTEQHNQIMLAGQ